MKNNVKKINKKNTTLPFIKTSDEKTIEKLIQLGFDIVDCQDNVWTFLNCPEKLTKIDFDSNNKIAFSKMLYI